MSEFLFLILPENQSAYLPYSGVKSPTGLCYMERAYDVVAGDNSSKALST